MLAVSKILYNISIGLYTLAIRFASIFHEKAALFVKGRAIKIEKKNDDIAWFHCASLGEFEQAIPLILHIRRKNPNYKIVLTFFSPSGYEVKKNTKLADYVYYLPIDTKKNARNWIETINPKIVFFIKYEFWWHYLNELDKKEIPTYLISSIFREKQIFFKSHGVLFREILKKFTHIFVQDENSKRILSAIGINNTTIAFDTRFDQVYNTATNAHSLPLIENFIQDKKCIIIGSSWKKDEELFKNILEDLKDYKLIFAPHDITPYRIKEIQRSFPNSILHSKLESECQSQILIIDSYGLLTSLYQYANISYIGGAFDTCVHNILEAAVYGMPLVFGPHHTKSKEAIDLQGENAAISISNSEQLLKTIYYFSQENIKHQATKASLQYVRDRLGGTKRIFQEIKL